MAQLTKFSKIIGYYLCLLQFAWASDHWGYPDYDESDEFPKWGGICDTGQLQSPIDVSLTGALKGHFPGLMFHNYGTTLISPSLVNNGHTIQLSDFSVQMTLSGGPLANKFIVEQIHFHWWSEHTINNIRYPLEAHIVHRNKRYGNFSQAVKHKNGIAVIALLFHVSNKSTSGIEKIVDNIEFIKDADDIDKAITLEENFNVRELFPNLSSGYLTYPGSLTTPPCTESVTWFILLDTFPITLEQVHLFKSIETHGEKKLTNNYREIQKKNSRPVVVVQDFLGSMAPPIVESAFLVVISSVAVVCYSHYVQHSILD